MNDIHRDRKIFDLLKYTRFERRKSNSIRSMGALGGRVPFARRDVHSASSVLRTRWMSVYTYGTVAFAVEIDRKIREVSNYTCFEHRERRSTRSKGETRIDSFIQDQRDDHSEVYSVLRARRKWHVWYIIVFSKPHRRFQYFFGVLVTVCTQLHSLCLLDFSREICNV